jgi:hypothetical protein
MDVEAAIPEGKPIQESGTKMNLGVSWCGWDLCALYYAG